MFLRSQIWLKDLPQDLGVLYRLVNRLVQQDPGRAVEKPIRLGQTTQGRENPEVTKDSGMEIRQTKEVRNGVQRGAQMHRKGRRMKVGGSNGEASKDELCNVSI